MVSHNVFFWLKPGRVDGIADELIRRARQDLPKVKGVKCFCAGRPMATDRKVVESSYYVGLSMQFEKKTDLERYQVDPIHQKFVKECIEPYVEKIVVFDFE